MQDGHTPLYTASFKGHREVVRLLLDKGAAVDKENNGGFTPLYVASNNGHLDAVRLLLQRGAAVNKANNNGATPLYIASQKGRLDVAHMLLDKGAAIDKANKDGTTPLLMACLNGHKDVACLLLDKGAAVDRAGKNGDTPIMVACSNGQMPVAQLLCERGANVHASNKDGLTALDWANKKGHSAVAAYIKGQQDARTAARPAASPPVPKGSTGTSAQRKIDVFVSFRVKEADTEAIALKRALEAENLSVFCSSVDIPRGADWVRTITAALHAASMVVVLATPTYGSEGTDSFGTAEELSYAKKKKKLLYVVPMADEWEDPTTDVLLGMIQKGAQWVTDRNVAPSAIVNDIVGALQRSAV
ncbi:ankyrin repeat-containing domain protein [Dunaliella salina]|uniref:Ankyrin repeat-containing domain protein n=1 Tax=Dunaliella salina TaxID=3046 RepID=A0ABQ7G1R6_DUNSA|nr:ankyrin repeat-containing domain protein [Dunaliella salina]|eukprot:KAF5828551.1 ankyrin repeat-containing domain protein [Dunaliella salina]